MLQRLNLLLCICQFAVVQTLHQLNLGCYHPAHVLILLVLQKLSLLGGVSGQLAHHAGHLVVG